MVLRPFLILSILFLSSFTAMNPLAVPAKEQMIDIVNSLRARGCYCGKDYMPPAEPVKWNGHLYLSALSHARDMSKNGYFSHYSLKGEDIGDRLEKHGYMWQVAGENLGEGQTSFEEVMRDWKLSKSHCKMLMNPKVEEMAVAKYGRYWVQHFGRKLPNHLEYAASLRDQ